MLEQLCDLLILITIVSSFGWAAWMIVMWLCHDVGRNPRYDRW